MEAGGFSASINFLLILPFISRLNSSTNSLPSYPLPLAAHLNSCMNSFIVLPPCSSFLSSAAFTASSPPPPNSFFKLIRNSSAVSYLTSPASNSSMTFSFYMSANPPCTCNRIQYTCSTTVASPIFILMYNLHAFTNPPMSRLLTMNLAFIFHFSFYLILFCFCFVFLFVFLFLEQLGLRFTSHAVASVTKLIA